MTRGTAALVGIAIALIVAACGGGGGEELEYGVGDLWLYPPPDSDFCREQGCVDVLSELSLLNEWTVTSTGSFIGEGDFIAGGIIGYEPKEAAQFTAAETPCCETGYYVDFLDEYPIDALASFELSVALFKTRDAAEQHISASITFQERQDSSFAMDDALLEEAMDQLAEVGYDRIVATSEDRAASLLVHKENVILGLTVTIADVAQEFDEQILAAGETALTRTIALLLSRIA